MIAAPESRHNDRLLWAGAAAIAALAIITYVAFSYYPGAAAPDSAASSSSTAGQWASATPDAGASKRDRLNRARLAYDAGMLDEPADQGAFSLYLDLLDAYPADPDALDGVETVADALVERAQTDWAQGQADEARRIVERVLDALPEHAGALELGAELEHARTSSTQSRADEPQKPQRPAAGDIDEFKPELGIEPVTAPALDIPDVTAELFDDVTAAIADDRLTAPPNDNAAYYVQRMRAFGPLREQTVQAEKRLLEALMTKYSEALDDLDTSRAGEWLDEAASLSLDDGAIAEARSELAAFVTALDSAETLSAGELEQKAHPAPVYPTYALERGLEGWVELEFTVSRDGSTRDIEVLEESTKDVFGKAATDAVAQWTFEPQRIMGHVVDARAHTRIRFVLQ